MLTMIQYSTISWPGVPSHLVWWVLWCYVLVHTRSRASLCAHTQVCQGANDYAIPSAPELPVDRLGEAARKALTRATAAVRRYGWLSFWAQLSLSVVSGVILLFSVAFTSQSGPKASLYLTLFGILAGFLSTFWNFGYTRTAMKMQSYLDAPQGSDVPKVKKQQVRHGHKLHGLTMECIFITRQCTIIML